jgi:hypothetical protein
VILDPVIQAVRDLKLGASGRASSAPAPARTR